jgi:hypothetical protein
MNIKLPFSYPKYVVKGYQSLETLAFHLFYGGLKTSLLFLQGQDTVLSLRLATLIPPMAGQSKSHYDNTFFATKIINGLFASKEDLS